MEKLEDLLVWFREWAPLHLAEDWDNVGLLIGDPGRSIEKVTTCLTVTPEVVQEAIDHKTDLLLTHHPLPFSPLKKITAETVVGKMVCQLIENKVAVYSAHTAFDSASSGLNDQLARRLGLKEIVPLIPVETEATRRNGEIKETGSSSAGVGRLGVLTQSVTAQEFIDRVKEALSLSTMKFSGGLEQKIHRVGVGCGSAGTFLKEAIRNECDLFVTGEASFHTLLEGKAAGLSLLLTGHYSSERFAMESLATELQKKFPTLEIWASRNERDPVLWV
ncbi:MAG: Nif3-like dinuclear metal center hexameric protein [Pirellulaceae bacterium]|nr:Nif3-like dinuclear metal center hexameric protein [Pirellulaceae bacterium]